MVTQAGNRNMIPITTPVQQSQGKPWGKDNRGILANPVPFGVVVKVRVPPYHMVPKLS